MKEFAKTQKVTYNLMSFTGFKALLIFSMLTEGPKSFEEIAYAIENHPYLYEKMSNDTIRVYINSLKRVGCVVKRTRGKDKISRYMIVEHPFELKLEPGQLQAVARVYKTLVQNMDIKDLLFMDNLFEKVGKYIKNDDFIIKMRKISMLNGINKNLLTELLDCCDKKLQIVIKYNSPNSGQKDVEILADRIDVLNGKIYLCGYGFEYKQDGIFLLNRIKEIKEIKLNKDELKEREEIKIVYKIRTEGSSYVPVQNEKVVEQNNSEMIIEHSTSNPFLLKQKLLEFGPNCTILRPENFKREFIELLENMKAGYCND